MAVNSPEVVVIGGGTGTSTLLEVFKDFTPNLSAVVNMSDDGGHSGILGDQLGVMPPGDVRQCLIALSNEPWVARLFKERITEGPLSGRSLGNYILAGLELQNGGDFGKAVEHASEILNITGNVYPVTLGKHRLKMVDGAEEIYGEHQIAHRRINSPDAKIELTPNVPINPLAADAIHKAGMIVIAPGNLYGSVLPALAVDGMREVLAESDAKKVLIANLFNLPGQTDGWHAAKYADKIGRYIGQNQIDYVLYNDVPPTNGLLERYAAEGELPVETSAEGFRGLHALGIGAHLISKQVICPAANDLIPRNVFRHDAREVGRQLMKLYYE